MGGQVYETLTDQIFAQGREEGRNEGHRLLLLAQIQKKLTKGKSLEQIVEETEETIETIRPLYEQLLQQNQK